MVTEEDKLRWFGGNKDAISMCDMISTLTHVWDDMVDKDKELTETDINNAFRIALVYLPSNKFYAHIQPQVMPLWVVIISAYEASNTYQNAKDEHGIELAHTLRHATAHIFAYAIEICVGQELAKIYIPEMWKGISDERVSDYLKEHLNA